MSGTCRGCRYYVWKSAGSSPVAYYHYCHIDPQPLLRDSQTPVDCRDYQTFRAPPKCSQWTQEDRP